MSAKSVSAIGFLTVVEDQQFGHCGGFLLLNPSGRPLEFHCTAPVKPNRAQEVLYGPTLNSYLHGELIGQTLVKRVKVEPVVICCDIESVLTLRPAVDAPVTLVQGDHIEGSAVESPQADVPGQRMLRVDPLHAGHIRGVTRLHRFSCVDATLAVAAEFADDEVSIRGNLEPFASRLALCEPFERIREAIREAQGSGR